MKKILITAVCSSLFFVTSVSAQTPYRAPYGGGYAAGNAPYFTTRPMPQKPASEVDQAGAVLKSGLKKLLGFFAGNQAPAPQQIAAFLDKEIAPYFDFAYMARWAAGGLYARMTAAQQQTLEQDIKTQFLSTMAQKLSSFNQQSVRYLAPRNPQPGQVELSIAIDNRGGYPARLDFRMYKSPQGWKVYDVSANGSSALVYYRQYVRQKMQASMMQQRYR